MYPTDLTVSAVVEHNGRYLLVKECAMGRRVLNHPGGHLEAGESPEQAAIRGTREETGCDIDCGELIGVYLWIHPQTRQQYLRIIYAGEFLRCDESAVLDEGIIGRRWLTIDEIESRRASLRSPVVLRCLHDYISGKRQSDALITGMLPLQENVHRVLASADLV